MSTGKKTKKLLDEERKPLVVGKKPELVPGSPRPSVSGPASAEPSSATSLTSSTPAKSYDATGSGGSKSQPPAASPAAIKTAEKAQPPAGGSGYQASAGPSQAPEPATSAKSSLSRQVFLGMIIALPSIPCGMSLGFSAISLDSLPLTVDEASWYASVTIMSYPVGSLLVGRLMDLYGRKPALISITVVSLIGWLMLSVPTEEVSLAKLLIGRILTGIAGGLASVPAAVYAAECLCPNNVKLRSSLVTWSTVALSMGIFLVYMTGAFLIYYNVASIATLISLVALVLVSIFIPESPVWLSSKGRHGDAEWSEREINIAPPPTPIDEPSASEWEDATSSPAPPPPPPEPATLKELTKPEVYKPLLIMIGFLFFQQFSGVYVVIAYMVDIIRAAGVVTVSPYWLTVVGGAVILAVSILASVVYPKTGVRAIATLSGLGTAITMFWIGIYLSIRPLWINSDSWYFLHWVPVFIILSNIALSTAGFLILPWSMLGEVFPLSVKGLAGGLATCAGFIFSFVVLKLYPFIQLGLGTAEIFYFFGSVALIGTMFVVAFLPETHGKTLQEIIDEFRKKPASPLQRKPSSREPKKSSKSASDSASLKEAEKKTGTKAKEPASKEAEIKV
ncbi:transporter [Nesidiocoris tenuis]|uniref:Transporter n=1 Tax=Nesidiocoris tenuis TaxID=355587 RepID=A0ABN7A8P1_9HEMI|nr:transporter [Nesidiocoris tenuis]